jgi:hypothetical protein
MACLNFSGKMSVSKLQENFKSEFGLHLRVYDGRNFAKSTDRLANIRKGNSTSVSFDIKTSTKVGTLENMFRQQFGLRVRIAKPDDSMSVSRKLTLNQARKLSAETPASSTKVKKNEAPPDLAPAVEKQIAENANVRSAEALKNDALVCMLCWVNVELGFNYQTDAALDESLVAQLQRDLNKSMSNTDMEALDFIDMFYWDCINYFESECDGDADETFQAQLKEMLIKIWPTFKYDIEST